MMRRNNYPGELAIVAHQNIKERNYWLKQLSGTLVKSSFPCDYRNTGPNERSLQALGFRFQQETLSKLMTLSKGGDHALHTIFVSAAVILLNKYTGSQDIIVGSPIFKQETQGEFINTVLVLRNQLDDHMAFRELLFQVRQTIVEASEHQNYPLEMLADQLDIPISDNEFPLFDTVILVENIQDNRDIRFANANMTFSFSRTNEAVEGVLEYNSCRYREATVERIISHFKNLMEKVLSNVNAAVSDLEILSGEEKKQLLFDFNDTQTAYPGDKTIHRLFEEQAAKAPDNIAVVCEDKQLTYRRLNEKANRLARILRKKGVIEDTIVGIMVERSDNMITGILGILKAGGAYLPIDFEFPWERIALLLDDCDTPILITNSVSAADHPFKALKDRGSSKRIPHRTAVRPQILDLNSVQVPDRSLIDHEKYNQYIGEAMVRNSISMQATRGCPYHCAYCHKIWPKKHVFRSTENIFQELMIYYNMGVRRFAFIDDIFNLNKKNSLRLFELIIENELKVHIFFPNGIRGDILTKDYIDTMVKAGTVNIAFALETASPRLQKLIGKNLDVDKLRENMKYTCETYPHVMIELFTMHGFPSETEEEAMMTLNFIKSLKWVDIPYVLILKIYPNTDMEKLALEHGVSPDAIKRSENLAYHELPDTLPFEKSFTKKYQADFLNSYILSKERLLDVLPHQLKVFTQEEIVMKYNDFLPYKSKDFEDLLRFFDVRKEELGGKSPLEKNFMFVPDFNQKLKEYFTEKEPEEDALRVLLLDLSQEFKKDDLFFDNMVEPPLGPMYILTHLYRQFDSKINGRIWKSGLDFDNFSQLKELMDEFNPEIIGIRTLTNTKNFFHKTVSIIKQWRPDVPVVAGGPYATSGYVGLLNDWDIDLVVVGEGEITFCEIIEKFMQNGKKMPGENVLKEIPGIAFIPAKEKQIRRFSREIIMLDELAELSPEAHVENLESVSQPGSLAYAMFTSGSTGNPKAVLVKQKSVVRLVKNTNFIEFRETDKLLQTGALGFDASTFEIWGPLLNGSSLYLLSKYKILAAKKLKEAISKYRINTIWMSSPLFNQMLDVDIEIFKGLENLVVGGEALSPVHINRVRKRFPGLNVINGYGPTENTTFSLTYRVDREYEGDIPVGKPISNSTAYILDRNAQLLPVGVVGELCVGGDGMARGYMNNPELTNRQFITDPFTESASLYKTGDLVKGQPDGNIEFLGRRDRQVKIRGYRVELGEIENRLLNYEGVRNAVLVSRESKSGDKYLCAYIVPHPGAGSSDKNPLELRKYLAMELPDYMIPSYFIEINRIPLTTNGKVDVKALPEPEVYAGGDYAAPGDEYEKALAEIWSEVLGIDKDNISINADFFELGGNSLNAASLVAKVHRELNIKLSLEDFFSTPVIKELAVFMRAQKKDSFFSIEPVEEKEYYKLSPAQRRMYVLQQMDSEGTIYNVPLYVVLEGQLNLERLENTFVQLIQRHESLRSSFKMINLEPVQKIHQKVPFAVEYHETGSMKDFVRPFDLAKAPLLRVGLIKEGEETCILMTDMHHIITDGTSMDLFIREFKSLYVGEELPPLRLQYKDYTEWLDSEKERETRLLQEKYWLEQFLGEIPSLNLPMDYTRPAVQRFEGHTVKFEIGKRNTGALKKIALEEGSTLYMILLAAFYVFLYKISGQEDIIVGTPAAGRKHADLASVVGMFVNTLALRSNPRGNKVFSEFFREIKENTLKAFENQDYPFDELVDNVAGDRSASRHSLFDVMFALQNIEIAELEIPGLELKPFESGDEKSKFDFTLNGIEAEEKLVFTVEYSTTLFKKETILKFISYFEKIADSIAAEPGIKLWEIEIISEQEKKQVLYDFNDTETEYPGDQAIYQLFAEQVDREPDNTAAVFGNQQLTYRRLDASAGPLAKVLREKGVTAGMITAIVIDRSIEMITGILGILKAGGAYLPVEPDTPLNRLLYMLEDCGSSILVMNRDTAAKYSLAPEEFRREIIMLDELDAPCPGKSGEHLEHISHWSDPAYSMFTSGSTGKPKGTLVSHRNVIRAARNTNYIDLKKNDRVLQLSNYAFDGSVFDIYGALLNGAALVMMKKEEVLAVDKLSNLIEKQGITVFFLTTAFFNTLVDLELKCLRHVRKILFGGERVSVEHVKKAFDYLGKGRVLHMYGPTESTVYSAYYEINEIDESLGTIPIGKPLANTRIYIVDDYLQPVPIGVAGEICIGGDGIARGYQNNAGLTKEKFIPNPFVKGDRLYKTGDRARWLPDGNMEFIGRKDHQVKIRGFRIELKEIEIQLLKHDKIKEAVVIAARESGDAGKSKYLCAYITAKEELNVPGLREYLARELPAYMIPVYFVQLKELPLTPSGKIDRSALPAPEGIELAGQVEYIAPVNEIERKLVETWEKVLKRRPVGTADNFFTIGGDSIKAIQIASGMKMAGYRVDLQDLFAHQSILELAPHVKEAREITGQPADIGTVGVSRELFVRLSKKYSAEDIYPLTPMQEGMLFHALYDSSSSLFINQSSYRFHDELNVPMVEKSINKLLERFDILRTVFIYDGVEDIERPLQAVLRERKIDIYYEDISEKTDVSEKEPFIERFRLQDRQRPFDLSKDLLLRAAIIKLAKSEYEVIWTYHCILMDGWARNVLFLEFMEIYNSYVQGRNYQLSTVTPFKTYIKWLEKRDKNVSKQYWRKYLEGYEEIAEVPKMKTPPIEEPGFVSEHASVVFKEDKTAVLNAIARRNHITLNIVFQTIWAIILGTYTGKNDVVFGIIVSGRPPEIKGIGTMVGLFTNMIPVRVRWDENTTFSQLLRQVQESAFSTEPHHYYPLVDIQSESPLKQDLFDHFYTFGNVPGGDDLHEVVGDSRETKKGIASKLTAFEGFEQTSYDLTIYGGSKETASMIFVYNANVYSRDFMSKITSHIEELVDAVIKNENIRVTDIEITGDLAVIESTIFDGTQPDFDF